MPIARVAALGAGAIVLAAAFLVLIMLVVYPPRVEYAYVEILDLRRDGAGPLFAAAEVCVLAAFVGLLPTGRRRGVSR